MKACLEKVKWNISVASNVWHLIEQKQGRVLQEEKRSPEGEYYPGALDLILVTGMKLEVT